MSALAHYNLTLDQGADYRITPMWLTGRPQLPVDLTGCTARLQIRETLATAVPIVSISTLATAQGGIILGGSAGTIAILITKAATLAIKFEVGVYDLFVDFPLGESRRFMDGRVFVQPRVTR